MKNNYKIIISKIDQLKISNINNINNLKYNSKLLNDLRILSFKLFILLILIAIFIKENNYTIQENKLQKNSPKKEIIPNKIEKNIKEPKRKQFFNVSLVKNYMHNYSLYNIFKSPLISIVCLNNETPKYNKNRIEQYLKFKNSKINTDFEIILCNNIENKYSANKYEKELTKYMNNEVLKIYNKQNNFTVDLYNIMNIIKGYYTIFVNNINLLENISFNDIYQYSKNSINKYDCIHITNDSDLYIVKTKLIKDLIDNGNLFNSIDDIIQKIENISLPEFNYIHISICPNNKFTNLVYVAMISILSSKATNTYICFYIIIPSKFRKKNINFIKSLEKEYDNFNITFIKMDERYKKSYTDQRITTEAYYRFSLGELLPNLNKIIYFDADIIVYKDLSNFYNLNFNGKIILGQATYGNRAVQNKGYHKINTGILLLNLLEMRKIKFEEKVINIIEKGKKLAYHDQTLLNDYFKEYIGIFPIEYHTRPWSNYKEIKTFNNIIGKVFDDDYYYFAHKYPTIRHFLGRYKPKKPDLNYVEDWWFFARKSKYYNNKATKFYNAFSF